MEQEKYGTRIATNDEIRRYYLVNGITEKEALEDALKTNPSEFHDEVERWIKEIFHPL